MLTRGFTGFTAVLVLYLLSSTWIVEKTTGTCDSVSIMTFTERYGVVFFKLSIISKPIKIEGLAGWEAVGFVSLSAKHGR